MGKVHFLLIGDSGVGGYLISLYCVYYTFVGLVGTKRLTLNVFPIWFYTSTCTKVICRAVCQRSLGSMELGERSPRKIKRKISN